MSDAASRRHARARLWMWVTAGLVIALAAFVGVARATDASRFCNTCHEMQPYYAAWASGTHGHEGVQCVDCHVKAGFLPRLEHKVVALGEVWTHFFGDRTFPRKPPDLPNSWCTRCHARINVNVKNFSHTLHETKGACRDCHPTTGHDVAARALKDAGVFNPNFVLSPFGRNTAAVNGGKANVPGHITVACSRCHDMQVTGCPACHTPPKNQQHQASANCTQCHQAGPTFVFKHPTATANCAPCHKVPAKHTPLAQGRSCPSCHQQVGASWAFRHPAASAQCLGCHSTPAKHPTNAQRRACTLCHTTRVSWAFAHPSAGEHSWRSFACTKCHSRGYRAAYCSCHGGTPPSGD